MRVVTIWTVSVLGATAVAVDEALTQRRLHRRLDAEYERDTADLAAFAARQQPMAYQYRSIETLLSLPTVAPDRTEYQRPDCGSLDAVMVWMVYERSAGWWETPTHDVRQAAVYWLAMRERLTGQVLR